MHLSGLVLDVYDDCSGSALKSIYPTREEIPLIVKTAHALEPEERAILPDDVFALVLVGDNGNVLRKYACVDPGNTVLAVAYFLQNKDKLPVEAQKTAASNLIKACSWYDIEPMPELAKIAGLGSLVGAAIPAVGTAMGIKGVGSDVSSALSRARQAKGVIDPSLLKAGEVTGTSLMPLQENTSKESPTYKTTVRKTAAIGHLVQGKERHAQGETAEILPQNRLHEEKNPDLRQHKQLVPYVNVQGEEPPSPTKMKVSHYALPGQYPLDTYQQVKCAAEYFDEYWKYFAPEQRHEYCVNLLKQADALHISVGDNIRKYGSVTYAPGEEVAVALAARRTLLEGDDRELLDKLAGVAGTVDPDIFAAALEELDRRTGLNYHYDSNVPDPFYSTFGSEKVAEYSFVTGSDYVNASQLKEFAISGFALLKKRFGEDLAKEFQKDPIGIFDSMPLEQKKVICRLSADPQPGRGES